MPHYHRYRFPGDTEPDQYPGPEMRARAMACLFLQVPAHELTVGRLESAAVLLTDRGRLEHAVGEPAGEELAPWLRLVVGPGGRRAWLDIDVDVLAAVQVEAERRRRSLTQRESLP